MTQHPSLTGFLALTLLGSPACDREIVAAEAMDCDEPMDVDEPIDVHEPLCPEGHQIEELPFALAWRETSGDGSTRWRVHLQSFEPKCSDEGNYAPGGHSRVRLEFPAGPRRFELSEIEAIGTLAPGGPGNTESVMTLAWLSGDLLIDQAGDDVVRGLLLDESVPFAGCFEAPVCAR